MIFLIATMAGGWLAMEAAGGTTLDAINGRLARIAAGDVPVKKNR